MTLLVGKNSDASLTSLLLAASRTSSPLCRALSMAESPLRSSPPSRWIVQSRTFTDSRTIAAPGSSFVCLAALQSAASAAHVTVPALAVLVHRSNAPGNPLRASLCRLFLSSSPCMCAYQSLAAIDRQIASLGCIGFDTAIEVPLEQESATSPLRFLAPGDRQHVKRALLEQPTARSDHQRHQRHQVDGIASHNMVEIVTLRDTPIAAAVSISLARRSRSCKRFETIDSV